MSGSAINTAAVLRQLLERNLQLWFEGDALRYKTPRGQLDGQTRALLGEHKQALRAMMGEGRRYAPASSGQRRLWFLEQVTPGTPLHHVPALCFRLSGELHHDALAHALSTLAKRQEALRTVFPTLDGAPVQCVLPDHSVPLALSDLTGISPEQRETEAMRQAIAFVRTPFDLEGGPLLRAGAWCLRRADDEEGEEQHLFVVAMHHIITDGWSITVLARELFARYRAALENSPAPFDEPPLSYADFTLWQRLQEQLGAWETSRAYWRQQLRGAPVTALTPVCTPRPTPTGAGREHRFSLSPGLTHALKQLASDSEATLFMVLLAGFNVLLYRHTGATDLVTGSGSANRIRPEFAATVGLFVNTLAIRIQLDGNPTFSETIARVKAATLGAFDHQEFPFERVVETVRPDHGPGETPFFRNALVFQNFNTGLHSHGALNVTRVPIDPGVAQFDLLLTVEESEGTLQGTLQYATDRFDHAYAQRIATQYQQALASAVKEPGAPIDEIPLMSPEEMRHVITRGQGTSTTVPGAEGIYDLFAAQAARTPNAPAVVTASGVTSYRELDTLAGRIAGALAKRGVARGEIVGVAMDRGVMQVAAVLGVLRAGGVFLPLDPGFPPARLEYMLRTAKVRRVIAGPTGAVLLAPLGLDLLTTEQPFTDAPVTMKANSQDLAYVIFTSGSTGHPKGALLEHGGAVSLACWWHRYFNLGPGKRVLQFAPMSYDAYVVELLGALSSGAALCCAPADTLLPGPALLDTMETLGVTKAILPPSVLAALEIPESLPSQLEQIVLAGEACTADLVNHWAGRVKLYNAYGPTETTVCASACDTISPDRPRCIGRPVDNLRLYVLDHAGQLAPEGMPGELCVAGVGVARGYLGETNGAFEQRLMGGRTERIYHTGDLVRVLADGQLEFLGRIDGQVKVNGHRIEPGEIAAVLRTHPGIREAAVVAQEWRSHDTRLVAFLVAAGEPTPGDDELRTHCKAQLPPYMAPSAFHMLDALPRTPGGKIDVARLARLRIKTSTTRAYAPPASPTEETVAALYAGLLGRNRVGRDDDFFALGGHSLLAARLVARIHEAFGVSLGLRDLFDDATVATVAASIDAVLREAEEAAGAVDAMSNDEVDEELARLLGEMPGDQS